MSTLLRSKPNKGLLRGLSSIAMTRCLSTKSQAMGNPPYQALRVNGERLMDTLHSSCEIGKAHAYGDHATETGMARLALNDDDKRIRDWFAKEAEAVGCTVTTDQMGSMFAVRPGKSDRIKPVYMGSHWDTQPTGGRYDGILGMTAALEAMRTIHENNYETEGPVGTINWTNEEGARFPIVTVASAVWAGVVPLEKAWSCAEVTPPLSGSEPQTMKQELQRIGYLGDIPASPEGHPIAAHFELHIEQGPILEDENRKIGVVVGGQAYNWYEVEVRGKDSHAGTTPLSARKDAMLAACKMIVASNKAAKDHSGVITTGILKGIPGSVNTMAHTIRFTLDIRHPSKEKLEDMVAQCRREFEHIAKNDSERGVELTWKSLTENGVIKFDADCIAAVEEAAEATCSQLPEAFNFAHAPKGQGLWKHMISGAGHDSCQVSRRSPAAMIFTPTRDGMSHTPTEYCKPEDCVNGAQVLLGAVLRYDANRSRNAGSG